LKAILSALPDPVTPTVEKEKGKGTGKGKGKGKGKEKARDISSSPDFPLSPAKKKGKQADKKGRKKEEHSKKASTSKAHHAHD
jgi:hypothetical protein